MTATPDRPATTPEGAGLADCTCGDFAGSSVYYTDCQAHNPAYPRRLPSSERTEVAGEVALSEEHVDGLMCQAETRAECDQDSHWTARRALPTAGRVVEVERVAEQVEALAAKWECDPSRAWPTQHLHRQACPSCRHAADLRALAAAIRAGGAE